MDRLLNNKLALDRLRHPHQLPSPTDTLPPPPPYAASGASASDDEADDSDDDEQPLRLTINAQQAVHGNNNLVPTSPSPLADATRLSAMLVTALKQVNESSDKRRVRVDLTINCGITVVGDRNVVGGVGLKSKGSSAHGVAAAPAVGAAAMRSNMNMGATAGCALQASAGAKRKAEDEMPDVPEAKRRPTDESSTAGTD
ncbi:hypothetical protein B0A48_15182 [Cryoendolithus antarcticus]|uniref:Uncharacterized protein n=1 Tax=Cryoendolithus antarcticus TaxID=1507870 RepID=A0A1V8SI68_9PEZI|nr:hypothetical protein B0A48_15182 [Cryoendolithus antarcticus]